MKKKKRKALHVMPKFDVRWEHSDVLAKWPQRFQDAAEKLGAKRSDVARLLVIEWIKQVEADPAPFKGIVERLKS